MTVETDPKTDNNDGGDDEFAKHFDEFAASKLAPNEEVDDELGDDPEGNDPKDEPTDPSPEKGDASAKDDPSDDVTSGDAKDDGDGKSPPDTPENKAPSLDGLSPEVLAHIQQLEKERDDARHRASSDANRVSALSRKLAQLNNGGGQQPPKKEEKSEADKALDAKVEQLKKDYGDIADPLIELIEKQRAELSSVKTVLTGMSEERQAQVIEQQRELLAKQHPDFATIASSQEFGQWLQEQPDNIQALAGSWDAKETSVVLTLFKTEKGMATPSKDKATPPVVEDPKSKADAATEDKRRSQQLDGGREIKSKPAPAASGAPDDFTAAFDHFSRKREAKMAREQRR